MRPVSWARLTNRLNDSPIAWLRLYLFFCLRRVVFVLSRKGPSHHLGSLGRLDCVAELTVHLHWQSPPRLVTKPLLRHLHWSYLHLRGIETRWCPVQASLRK